MSSGDERFDSTDRGESSRGKNNYTSFNPRLGPEFYKAENLEKFILTAGTEEINRFRDALAQEKKRLMDAFVSNAGVNPNQYDNTNVTLLQGQQLQDYNSWKRQIAALHQEVARTGEYRRVLQALRYNWVMNLHNAGRLRDLTEVSQAEAANVGLAREITKADVINKLTTMGRDAFLLWLDEQTPEGFKANALEEAARQLQVRGFSTISGTGNTRKTNLYNLIMNQTGGRARQGLRTGGDQGAQPNVQTNNNLTQELQRRGIRSTGQLTAMRSDDLKELAKQFNVPQTGKKAEIINNIAATAGMTTMRGRGDIEADVDALIRLAATDPLQAREQGRNLDPNELTQVPLPKMRQLSTALQLRREFPTRNGGARSGAPSRDLIIATLTGARTERSRSRENREQIIADRNTCLGADLQTVQRIAQDLRIPTIGLSQEQLCDRIYAYHLTNLSSLILRRGGDLEQIANMAPDQQGAAVRRLATQLRVGGNVQTLDDLIRQWMTTHYQGRALSLYPQRQQDVSNFLATGALPQNADALRDLSVVFSDIRRDMYNMDDAGRQQALGALYNQFVARLQQGGSGGVGTFLANLNRFGFGTNQQGSPNRVFNNANANLNGNGLARQQSNGNMNGNRSENTLNGVVDTNTTGGYGPTTLSHPNISTQQNIRFGNGVQNAHRNMNGDFNVASSNYDDLRGFATKVYSRDADVGGENNGLDTNANGLSVRRGDYVNPDVDDQAANLHNAFVQDSIGEGTQPGHYSMNNGSRPDLVQSTRNGSNTQGGNGRNFGSPLNAMGGEYGSGLPTDLNRSFGNGNNGFNGNGGDAGFGSDFLL